MTDDDRKFLTEAMGECWHTTDYFNQCSYICRSCGLTFDQPDDVRRTFTTWDDFGAVKNFLIEMWQEFHDFAEERYLNQSIYAGLYRYDAEFALWLIDKIRFPELAVHFLKEERQ